YLIGVFELGMSAGSPEAAPAGLVDLLPEPRRRPPDDLRAAFDIAARDERPRLADALLQEILAVEPLVPGALGQLAGRLGVRAQARAARELDQEMVLRNREHERVPVRCVCVKRAGPETLDWLGARELLPAPFERVFEASVRHLLDVDADRVAVV